MLKEIEKVTEGFFDDSFIYSTCPKCKASIELDEILNLVSYNKINAMNIAKVPNAEVHKCPQCQVEKSSSDIVLLECGHKFCYQCVIALINHSMANNIFIECGLCASDKSKVADPNLPANKKGINPMLIYIVSDKKLAKKMFDMAFQTYKSIDSEKIKQSVYKDALVDCSNCGIHFSFPFLANKSILECPYCYFFDLQKRQMKYWNCFLCCQRGHDGMTCIDAAKINPEVLAIRKNNPDVRVCPYCFEPTTRISGCNMMTCKSSKCAPLNKTFCYICEQKIEPAHDYKHFDPYGHSNQYCKNRPQK
jgi:hypothetical protein